jgi:hypothetical protein
MNDTVLKLYVVLFPDLVEKSRLGKPFDVFFGEMRENTSTSTHLIRSLLKKDPQWLVSNLCRPLLAITRYTKTDPGWFKLSNVVTSMTIGENIDWYFGEDPTTARDWESGRPLFMDQILIEKPIEVELTDRMGDSTITTELSGTTSEVLAAIRPKYSDSIKEHGYTLSFEGIGQRGNGKYFLNFGTI